MTLPRFTIGKLIGSGSFGKTFLGTDTLTNKDVALKIEKSGIKPKLLEHEYQVYQDLGKHPSLPEIYAFENLKNPTLIMQLLGDSLEDKFYQYKKKLPLHLILSVAINLLHVIEHVHASGYIHRDIKPDNIMFGPTNNSDLFLVDFGLSYLYIDKTTQTHMPLIITNHGITGTDRFVGINAHFGHNQSRRDDMESIGIMLVYLVRGRLIWQAVSGNNNEKQKTIRQLKMYTSLESICQGMDVEFMQYLRYCRSLEYDAKPDYQKCRDIFINLSKKKEIDFNSSTVIQKQSVQKELKQKVQLYSKRNTIYSFGDLNSKIKCNSEIISNLYNKSSIRSFRSIKNL